MANGNYAGTWHYVRIFKNASNYLRFKLYYTVSHNYGNPYKKWNIFVARPHLWLQLGMVKPEIILCETVLNLSTLNNCSYLLIFCHTSIVR